MGKGTGGFKAFPLAMENKFLIVFTFLSGVRRSIFSEKVSTSESVWVQAGFKFFIRLLDPRGNRLLRDF
jgi:hypothetical protein